ncbi:MAG: DUF86 domain-containing protein [Nanoarchaeota archaeon]|nr:DUF86 domain-containing protein [Nanoarchaeota archaeon]
MKKDIAVFLSHILESIEKVREFTHNVSKDKFKKDVKLQDAVIRRIEIIGEAAKNIPSDFREKHPAIPWAEMARTRDKLIHGYFGVDLDLTWNIIKLDLPSLKEKIGKIMKKMKVSD